MLFLRPKHLKRYKDLAWLLMKYGQSDLVKQSGLHQAIGGSELFAADSAGAGPEDLAADLEKLGPTYVKLGQLLSTRADFLPPAYLEALERLQDDLEPFSFEEVERTIETELGVRISRIFPEFSPQPIASASLAQVHKANLRDGREVAVKVQRPGIRETITDDLDALDHLAEILETYTETGKRYRLTKMTEHLRRMLMRELDYRLEAQHLRTLCDNLSEFKRICVPLPIDDFTSGRVLTMEFMHGRKITELGPHTRMDLDGEALADELFDAYLHQVLVDGFFHADPHPGNLLLTPDHRIAILDVGMTEHVPPRLREDMVKLLMAISEGRGEEAAEVAIRMGHEGRRFERHDFISKSAQLVEESKDAALDDVKTGEVVMQIQRIAAECDLQLPLEVTLLGKAFMNLDTVLVILDEDFQVNEALRRHASEVFRERAKHEFTWGKLYQSTLELNEFVQRFPERLNKIMSMIANNELRVNVEAVDEKQLISGIEKVANRITAGLVLAALIIGASLLAMVTEDYTLLGIPIYKASSTIFFLLAATAGLYLAVSSMLRDKRKK